MNLKETIKKILKEEVNSQNKQITQFELVNMMGTSDIRNGDRVQIIDDAMDLFGSKIKINVDHLNQETLNKINNFMDKKGWFPTKIKLPNGVEGRYSLNIKNSLGNNNVEIQYEVKTPGELNINSDKTKAYHVTPDIFLNKIKEEGLKPKTESKLSDHPERIYLFLNPEETFKQMVRQLWNSLSDERKKTIKNFYVLEIDLTQLPNHKFYMDPQASLTYMAIFTLQPIPNTAIKVIDKITTSNIKPNIVISPEEKKREEEEMKRKEIEWEKEKKEKEKSDAKYSELEKQISQLSDDDLTVSLDDLLGLKESIRRAIKKESKTSELTERCWKGYTQKGMKTMFGKRYPNCVKIKKK